MPRRAIAAPRPTRSRSGGLGAAPVQAEDLAGYVPSFGWEMGPPTEGQLKTLEKWGIFPDEIESAGKASKLIDRLIKRKEEGLATPKQIRFLESKGFLHVGTWQFERAKRLINRIAANGWRVPRDINPYEYKPPVEEGNDVISQGFSWATF